MYILTTSMIMRIISLHVFIILVYVCLRIKNFINFSRREPANRLYDIHFINKVIKFQRDFHFREDIVNILIPVSPVKYK